MFNLFGLFFIWLLLLLLSGLDLVLCLCFVLQFFGSLLTKP